MHRFFILLFGSGWEKLPFGRGTCPLAGELTYGVNDPLGGLDFTTVWDPKGPLPRRGKITASPGSIYHAVVKSCPPDGAFTKPW